MNAGAPLGPRLAPCGPVLDAAAAARAFERLDAEARGDGWSDVLQTARAALAPVFGAAPYLAQLAVRRPGRLRATLEGEPRARLAGLVAEARAAGAGPDLDAVRRRLRRLKGDIHLLAALADLGGVWDLAAVTAALSEFADAAVAAALEAAAGAERRRRRLLETPASDAGPAPGLFVIAMGKYGAGELNYSSDVDISVFFDPDQLPAAEDVEPQRLAVALTQTLAELLQQRTADGYVFRVDLRLRPDPSATPPAVTVAGALDYYETVGQNWERAAYIKARPAAGDLAAADAFLSALSPFVWRRNLDFTAIEDIKSIKRQIHVHKVDERLEARGADVKLGRGGIREVEFFVQTQQLILGGRDRSLRSRETLVALSALVTAGVISPAAGDELSAAYVALRGLEHRAQMVADEQTHRLPEADADRRRIAALSGDRALRGFDARVGRILKSVNRRYAELFSEGEDLSSRFGSLVFTGVEDDPETLKTLARMGFADPPRAAARIRNWHHGHIPATRTETGRALFTRLAPRLLEAAGATGAADLAFDRFSDFFERLSGGVQAQALFLAQPRLFGLLVETMTCAPELARELARRPSALDALLDRTFFRPFEAGEAREAMDAAVAAARGDFEGAMNAARRGHAELAFRVGVQVMSGEASADQAGQAFADLADACVGALAPAALLETERVAGRLDGEVAVVALGKCGSREMSAGSDLDLMTVYRAADPDAASAAKGWSAETFYARFTQRLISALSAPTAEGGLYAVDMRLRPSGTAGPVAVSAGAFERYYAEEAETWEFLALTRARVIWASAPSMADWIDRTVETALRRPRDPAAVVRDAREMRDLIASEKPPAGPWDLKLSPGGLVDIEFVAQTLQILSAADGGPLRANTGAALTDLAAAAPADRARLLESALDAWRLQQDLLQVLKLALPDNADPAREPAALRSVLARAAGVRSFRSVAARLAAARRAARKAYAAVFAPSDATD